MADIKRNQIEPDRKQPVARLRDSVAEVYPVRPPAGSKKLEQPSSRKSALAVDGRRAGGTDRDRRGDAWARKEERPPVLPLNKTTIAMN